MSVRTGTVTAHVAAPVDEVWRLVSDIHTWPRWGPFGTDPRPHLDNPLVSHPVRLGRRRLHVRVESPDAPYWVRYRLIGDRHGLDHHAEVILAPTGDGGTDLHWHATVRDGVLGAGQRRARRLERFVHQVVSGLATHAASSIEQAA